MGRTPSVISVKVVKKKKHPWKDFSPHGYAVSVDGGPFVEGRELTLQDGREYTFEIDAPGHPFYIGHSPIGGAKFPESVFLGDTGGVQKGEVRVRVPEGFSLSDDEWAALGRSNVISMYYQCGRHRSMGGPLILSAETEWLTDIPR